MTGPGRFGAHRGPVAAGQTPGPDPQDDTAIPADDGTRWLWSPELRVWNGWRPGEDGLWELTAEEMRQQHPDVDRRACARCKVNRRAHPMMGCLCESCETAIEGMTQAQLDEDERLHR